MNRIAGLDWLRLFAIVLVTLQHALSVVGRYDQTSFYSISLGQTGVAIFCAISGYLAFGRANEPVQDWLWGRLRAIFPAYWLVMLFSFALTALFNIKSFSLWQFVSQMLGLGYFTHGWQLVNVVSWFISLILLCYVIAAAARASRQPLAALAVAFAVSAALVALRLEVDLSRHVIAFVIGASLRLSPPHLRNRWLFVVLVGTLLLWWQVTYQFAYATLAGMLVWSVVAWPVPHLSGIERAAKYTYEYFLLHGVFLAGLTSLMPNQAVLGIVAAVLVSLIAAVVLQRVVLALQGAIASYGR